MTRNQENVLYLVNLIDAEARLEATGSDKWEDADLDAILADYSPFGSRAIETFGKRLERSAASGVGAYVDSQISLSRLNEYRREIAHYSKSKAEPYQDLEEVARVATRVAKASTGRNFDFVSRFAALDDLILEAIGAIHGTHPQELGAVVVACAHDGTLNASDVRWLWRYVNLRNRHVHTGRALKADERRFVASIEGRLAKMIESRIATKAGLKRIREAIEADVRSNFDTALPKGFERFYTAERWAKNRREYIEGKKREHKVATDAEAIAAEVTARIETRLRYCREFLASFLN